MSSVSSNIVRKVVKRDGRTVDFDFKKVADAIFKAAQSVGGEDRKRAEELAVEVMALLETEYPTKTPSVENVQDLVEKVLIDKGHARTAKAYILYRHKRNEERHQRAMILGEQHLDYNLDFSQEALKILERRYLLKDENGQLLENPQAMLWRVANAVAAADQLYGADKEAVKKSAEKFFALMADRKFFPNTPTLMNAGTKTGQVNACYVLPIDDSMESIFGTLHDAAVVHQQGGGTGFSFSRLRPKRDPVKQHQGIAPGPLAFLRVYDRALDVIKQGGVRPGANMAVLRVDHPDIIRFIESKRDKQSLKNFNISVGVTDRFMKSVEEDREYFVKNPRTDKYVGKLRARDVFAVITQNAWKTGDPGLLFLDEINRKHPARHLGEIETTNQCGEAPLLPYESCALGSIDVNKYVVGDDLDWQLLEKDVKTAIHFLDNIIDINKYPRKEIAVMTKKTRKLGLGVMGFADMLFQLGIKYDSEEGLEVGDKLLSFFKKVSSEMSEKLAVKRGVCSAWEGSDYEKVGRKMRNMTCISLSPTGTRSILADTSAGCDPVFAISYQRTVLTSNELVFINKQFERVAKERGFYSPELIRKISLRGGIQQLKEIPKDVREIFVTAQDISPEWHIRMQSTLQKHVDNSISKTINFPRTAAIKDVENAYMTAWKARCKGITIYRDGSYEDQVITIGEGL
ncbi:ribonucleoside-diphosphate reductase, adenosylcobalamin-dependent [Candidatus Woesearchaeota archaeon CG10_big_fil_rev_8_21_14_0_10_45_16]|nr:MAG: ribonucleoside-diphosphate reductase, adenosylcobalamin-dependent [Candidatus Woesearchaeota archaeon CG10_big_fil_rev_8_21_14_0_10_45_16]